MNEEWEIKRLGDVCDLIARGVAPSYIDDGGICVLNQKCVRDHQVSYELARRHDAAAKRVNPERLLRAGDVLINSTGTGTLGRVAQVREETPEPTTVDTHVTIVRPQTGRFYPDFFGYMLVQIEDEIAASGEGASGQTELARSVIENRFRVSFPTSLAEQKRIVAILDEAFAGIAAATANAEKNLANARELFNGYLSSVFNLASERWPQKAIGDIAEHSLGKMLDKGKNRGSLQPYLRNLNVRWFEFDLDDVLEMRFEADEQERYTAIKGDVLICEGGYPGRAAIWQGDDPIYFQKALHRVRFEHEALGRWFVYFLYLSDATDELRQHFTGSGIQHLTGQALHKLCIPLPSLPTVEIYIERFDDFFEQTKKLEAIYRQKLSALADLKQSILQKAFSGELTALPGAEMQEEAA